MQGWPFSCLQLVRLRVSCPLGTFLRMLKATLHFDAELTSNRLAFGKALVYAAATLADGHSDMRPEVEGLAAEFLLIKLNHRR